MRKDADFSATEPGSIYKASVNQSVHDDEIVPAEKGTDRADRRCVSSAKAQSRFRALKSGKCFVQLMKIGRASCRERV